MTQKNKQFFSLLLCIIVLMCCIACDHSKNPTANTTEEPNYTSAPSSEAPRQTTPDFSAEQTTLPSAQPSIQPASDHKINAFYSDMAKYVTDNQKLGASFIISPTSLRASVCLAITGSGIGSATKDQLLKAAGFSSEEEAELWYNNLLRMIDRFDEITDENERFSVANSVWSNSSLGASFKDSYINVVQEKYRASATVSDAYNITDDINHWVDQETNGLIPSIISDASFYSAILVNALYLKTAWCDRFDQSTNVVEPFFGYGSARPEIEYMTQITHCDYYEDDETKIAVIHMDGDISFVCVLGSRNNMFEKIYKCELHKVHLKLPKFSLESSFENLMQQFLYVRGAEKAFCEQCSDFSEMSEEKWYISTVLQKSKITVDENGLEAAAASAIVMAPTSAEMPVEETEEIKEFFANEPFVFMLFSGFESESPEMLFYGQYETVN